MAGNRSFWSWLQKSAKTPDTYLTAAKQYYTDHLMRRYGTPVGSSEQEIRNIEDKFGRAFPAAFREYLLWMGNDKGGVFRGSEWFLSVVPRNTEALPDLLAEHDLALDGTMQPVCFFMHQGYVASWFDLNASVNDPSCYSFSEGFSEPAIEGPVLFSDLLVSHLNPTLRGW